MCYELHVPGDFLLSLIFQYSAFFLRERKIRNKENAKTLVNKRISGSAFNSERGIRTLDTAGMNRVL